LTPEPTPARRAPRDLSKARKYDFVDCWLSRPEAADLLGVSVSALANDVVHGRLAIPRHKFGQVCRYRLSELVAWAESRKVA
jgi:Helix-turn-helix domain